MIGDLHTVALVDKGGSIDWLCLPRFDSGAVFAQLVGGKENGSWQMRPSAKVTHATRRYVEGTLVLETDLTTAGGSIRVTDFMPPSEHAGTGTHHPTVVRIVEGLEGSVEVKSTLRLRFDYGSIVPWIRRVDGLRFAIAGPDAVVLRTPVETQGREMATRSTFTVQAGEKVPFTLRWQQSNLPVGDIDDPHEQLQRTLDYWREWSGRSTYDGPHAEAVTRSLITLKALTYAPTGGVVAAATTSLPESLGGSRNWDYRFCWLRDTTFTLLALFSNGYQDEAAAWREWLLRAIAGDPSKLQIMYGLAGERRLQEYEVPWLAGYADSAPVRVGNGAVNQRQLDVYGEVLDALYVARHAGLHRGYDALQAPGAQDDDTLVDDSWPLQKALVQFLETSWDQPDDGIWEIRGPQQHFVHSKVMAWVAMDRAVRSVREGGMSGPVERWEAVRDQIRAQVLEQGFDHERNTFTQYYGSAALDAATLLIPLVGFLPGDDPRMIGTVAAIEQNLLSDGFVKRYDTAGPSADGLQGEEGTFLMCTFWLADNYVLQGRKDDATALFERLLALRNDVGLLAEEYDPKSHRMLGNFPQAFSHTGLVNSAGLAYRTDHGKARHKRGRPHAAPHLG